MKKIIFLSLPFLLFLSCNSPSPPKNETETDKFIGTWYDNKGDTIAINSRGKNEFAIQIKNHIYHIRRAVSYEAYDEINIRNGFGDGYLQGNKITFSNIYLGKTGQGETLTLVPSIQYIKGTQEHFTLLCKDESSYSGEYKQSSEIQKL